MERLGRGSPASTGRTTHQVQRARAARGAVDAAIVGSGAGGGAADGLVHPSGGEGRGGEGSRGSGCSVGGQGGQRAGQGAGQGAGRSPAAARAAVCAGAVRCALGPPRDAGPVPSLDPSMCGGLGWVEWA